jgi:HEAT repeat protein
MKNEFEGESTPIMSEHGKQEEAFRTALFVQKMRVQLGLPLSSAFYEKPSLEKVLADLSSEDWSIRVRAVRGLEQYDKETTRQPLLQALLDPAAAVRGAAARVLSTWGTDAPMPELYAARHDPDWSVRVSVIQALGKMKQHTLLPIFPQVLASDPSPAVRMAAIWALAYQPNVAPIEPLQLALQDSDPLVRMATAQALAEFGERVPICALVQALDDPEKVVSTAVSSTLEVLSRQYPHHVPVEFLRCSLQHHQDEMVRASAACVLGELKTSVSIGPLIQALHDTSAVVRGAAAQALKEVQLPQPPSRTLTRVLHAPESVMREEVRLALEQWKVHQCGVQFASMMQSLLDMHLRDDVHHSWFEIAGKMTVIVECRYESLNKASQDAMYALVQEVPVEQFQAALQEDDEVICALAKQVEAQLAQYPLRAGCLLASIELPARKAGHAPIKVVLHCMNTEPPPREPSCSWTRDHRWKCMFRQLPLPVIGRCSRLSGGRSRPEGIRVWYASSQADLSPASMTSASCLGLSLGHPAAQS